MARALVAMLSCWCGLTFAVTPGLDSRAPVGAYMNGKLPSAATLAMPALLSETGVFANTALRTPDPGLVPYALNSPLWTDGAVKSRFIAVPFDGTPGSPGSPAIGFHPTGNWTFPNGTVIVKNFDMVLDERSGSTLPIRRLETRLLVRNADGTLRGATYRWNAGETDAVRVDAATKETVTVTQSNGTTRRFDYLYPGPDQCLRCHNTNAGLVLGIRTGQLNGDLHYEQTNRTDNQLHTLSHLGMLSTTLPDTATYPQFDKMAGVAETTATLENRVRSYLSSNCGHCHRGPGNGEGPIFDARYETPILAQNIVSNTPFGTLIRRNLLDSRLYVRDSVTVVPGVTPSISPMPPLARSIPDPNLLATYDAWVNDPYDVALVTSPSPNQVRVQFNRPVDPVSAVVAGNYDIDSGATISLVTPDADPSVVFLTTTTLSPTASYTLTVNRVKEAAAPQNPIWPNTAAILGAPGAPTITSAVAGNGQVTLSFTAPTADGGVPITGYTATCNPGTHTAPSTPGALSIVVTGLTPGLDYDCFVIASNAAGDGRASASVTVVLPLPRLTSVVSRKTHAGAGVFELPIDPVPPINGLITVEPRIIGSGHTIVFKFDMPITAAGSVTLTQSPPLGGAVAVPVAFGDEVAVTLTGVTDNQRVTVSLAGINGAQNASAAASIGFLVGDVNNSRSVNSSDISAVKARSGQSTTQANFNFDVNVSGTINSSDISAVKARSGSGLQ